MSVILPFIRGELQPKPRSGHASVFYNGQFIIHGGYSENSEEHIPVPTDEIWCFNVEVSQWTRYSTVGSGPSDGGGLSGSCACICNGMLFLVGGFAFGYDMENGPTSSVFTLNLHTHEWTDHSSKIQGNPPSRRDKLCCWVYNSKILYFGGFGSPPPNDLESEINGQFVYEHHPWGPFGWNNHVYVLDCSNTNELMWHNPSATGDVPSPRAAHAGAKLKRHGYMFGGRFQNIRSNDMYSIDLDKYIWKLINISAGSIPVGRSWHVLEQIGENHLFLYGGVDTVGQPLGDAWIFDSIQTLWHPLPDYAMKLGSIKNRMWHSAEATDVAGEVIVFGGCTNSVLSQEPSTHINDIIVWRFIPLPLEKLCVDYIIKNLGTFQKQTRMIPVSIQAIIQRHSHALGISRADITQVTSSCVLS